MKWQTHQGSRVILNDNHSYRNLLYNPTKTIYYWREMQVIRFQTKALKHQTDVKYGGNKEQRQPTVTQTRKYKSWEVLNEISKDPMRFRQIWAVPAEMWPLHKQGLLFRLVTGKHRVPTSTELPLISSSEGVRGSGTWDDFRECEVETTLVDIIYIYGAAVA